MKFDGLSAALCTSLCTDYVNQLCLIISLVSHSQGPVSVGVAVHGLLPLKSISRCRMSALQVPAHAPQLSHVVQAPSSENDCSR